MKKVITLIVLLCCFSVGFSQSVVQYNDVKNQLNRVYNPQSGYFDFIPSQSITVLDDPADSIYTVKSTDVFIMRYGLHRTDGVNVDSVLLNNDQQRPGRTIWFFDITKQSDWAVFAENDTIWGGGEPDPRAYAHVGDWGLNCIVWIGNKWVHCVAWR